MINKLVGNALTPEIFRMPVLAESKTAFCCICAWARWRTGDGAKLDEVRLMAADRQSQLEVLQT